MKMKGEVRRLKSSGPNKIFDADILTRIYKYFVSCRDNSSVEWCRG